ncbi:GNAT family N-acetyltransferase [Larkinella arboricola]
MKTLVIPQPYQPEEVIFPDRMDEIGALRVLAWRHEPGADPAFFTKQSWIEPLDETAFHWIIRDQDRVVASARMSLHPTIEEAPYANLLPASCRAVLAGQTIASFNRLVVDPQFRGLGLSKRLDQARLQMAARHQVGRVVTSTQLAFRVNSLLKLGFSPFCELRNVPERPEWPLFFMEYNLHNRPADASATEHDR